MGKSTGAEDKYMFYTVKKGDTLGAIARAFTTTIREILNLNSQVDPDRLRIGEKLKIKAN